MDLISINEEVALNKQRVTQFPFGWEVVDFLLGHIDTLTKENKALNTEKVGMIASLCAFGTEVADYKAKWLEACDAIIEVSNTNQRLRDAMHCIEVEIMCHGGVDDEAAHKLVNMTQAAMTGGE